MEATALGPTEDDTVGSWYEKATVRYTPRIFVPDGSSDELIYPTARSVVCEHPAVAERGAHVRNFILTQAAYQFLYGVGLLETKFVIDCSLNIVHGRFPGTSESDRLRALTVIIDEGYHAYVALDYVAQTRAKTGIDPLQVPESNRKLDAAARGSARLPEELRTEFQLLAVTLAENVLTEEIASLGRNKGLVRSFSRVMTDHILDEGRHSKYFAGLMKRRWSGYPESLQARFGQMLPEYLDDFLGVDLDRALDRRIVLAAGLPPRDVDRVLQDTRARYVEEQADLAAKTKRRLFRMLQQIGVLALAANRQAFSEHGYAA